MDNLFRSDIPKPYASRTPGDFMIFSAPCYITFLDYQSIFKYAHFEACDKKKKEFKVVLV